MTLLPKEETRMDGKAANTVETGVSPVSRGLSETFLGHVKAAPGALAIWDDRGVSLTRAQLWAAAETLGGELRDRGVGPGDVAIIILPNWIEWQVAHLAIRQIGAIPANIPIRTDAKMLAHVAGLVSARCIIGADTFGGFPVGEILTEATRQVAHRIDCLVFDASGASGWQDNAAEGVAAKITDPNLDHLMFTSSTTGMPKAVMHSKGGLDAFHDEITERFPLEGGESVFMGSPLGHSVGAIHGARMSLYLGLPLILQQSWNAAAALDLIETHQCRFTAAATPFLKDLVELDHDGVKLQSMRYFLCGGAQVPPGLLERAQVEFPETFVTVLWGMTEGGYTTCIPNQSPQDKILTTAGCPSAGLEIKLVDDQGIPVARGVEGNLHVRGPAMFYGYYGQPELTEELFGADGFFDCGDRALMDAEGYIRITGRSKDIIVRGGVNISPIPIEDVLATHPEASSVAVVGYPDERLGERICAVFGPASTRLDLSEVLEFARENGLSKQYWPEKVFHIEEMPMTPAGKIRKNDVRAWLLRTVGASA